MQRPIVIGANSLCENSQIRPRFDPYTNFCMAESDVCTGDGPVMGIDTNDSENPFWYVFGFTSLLVNPWMNNSCTVCLRRGTQVVPYLDYIFDKLES